MESDLYMKSLSIYAFKIFFFFFVLLQEFVIIFVRLIHIT